MITLLAKIFVKGDEKKQRQAYGTLCSITGIFLNIILFVIKYIAGVLSGSIAIIADAFNNLSDAGSSFITLVGFLFAGKKPDTDHPFGHGRFEYISGFIVSMLILFMGYELGKSSVNKIIHPENIETGFITIVILVISITVKLYMALYNSTIGKKINSAAMKATSVDSLSDTLATFMVLVSMLIVKFTSINLDGIFGLIVAIMIGIAGIKSAKDTIDPLLGQLPDDEFVKEIERIVMSHEYIIGIHDLVVHDYGPGRRMISLHAEVPGNINIYSLHDVIDVTERELFEALSCEAVIHMDPIEVDNEVIKAMKVKVADKVAEIDTRITIHDFRMVQGETHTNLIFDAVVPYEVKMKDAEVKDMIKEKIKTIDEKLIAVITIDKSYVK
jgi:cation diffusion facilitator family transporter